MFPKRHRRLAPFILTIAATFFAVSCGNVLGQLLDREPLEPSEHTEDPAPPEPARYRVIYDGNGNTGGACPSDGNAYLPGEKALAPGPGDMSLEGFTFSGWNDKADGSGLSVPAGTEITIGDADRRFYAM